MADYDLGYFDNMNYLPEWYLEKVDREKTDKNGDFSVNEDLKLDKEIEKPIISAKRIGMTLADGGGKGTFVEWIKNIAARTGASTVELETGEAGRSHEPVGAEAYGKNKREAIKEISLATGVEINAVHAPTSIGNVSGLSQDGSRGGMGFSEKSRENSIHRIKNVIDFAADVVPMRGENMQTDGISITVHTGEFPRNFTDQKWYSQDKEKFGEFKLQPEDDKNTQVYLVNKENDQIDAIRKQDEVFLPTTTIYKDGDVVKEVPVWDDELYKDKEDKLTRMPKDDDFKINSFKFDDFQKAIGLRKQKDIHFNDDKEKEKVEFLSKYVDLLENSVLTDKTIKLTDEDKKEIKEKFNRPDFAMYVASRIDPAIRRSYGSEWFREQHFENRKESLHALRKAREYYAELIEKSKNNPNLSNIEKEWMEYATNNHHLSQEVLVPGLKKSKLDIIDNEINNAELALKEARETITASRAERQKALSMIKDFVPIDDYAKKRSVDSFAKLGEYAYEVEKKKGLQKPIRIAMENIFPEMGYGSHPDELKDLVLESRKQMTDNLLRKNPKLNKKDAEKIAKDHIKATLDTEHMGMWKEYFYSKNPDKRDEEFNKWFLEKVNDLNDNGIIGNVHLVDTFGSGHVHLPVGEGSMPLKQAIQDLVKGGFKGGINSEGYSAGNSEQLFSAWRNIGTNVYASQGGKGATWTDVRKDNTFQRYKPGPYYVFGNYSPSQEWRPFSRMPLD